MPRATFFRRAWLAGAVLGLMAYAAPAWGQSATLRGFIKDAADGQPLLGVNVALTGGGGELYGNATDTDGFFIISRLPPGRYAVRVTYIGYESYADTLDLAPGQFLTYNLELSGSQAELGEVVVESERETAGAASVTAGLQTVRPEDIKLVPAPDVSGDLVTYLQTLPGVVSTGDQGGQLFIRGGEPTQNLVLLDGMLVYQPFHLVGFYSAFPADVISSTDVYAGGFGARYGGRLSSVIDVATRNGNKRRFAGAVSVAPFVSAARLEGPIVPNRVSLLVSGRTSVIEQGAAKLVDAPLPYAFDDQFAKIHANLSETSQLSISALRTYDRGTLGADETTADNDETDQVVWNNRAIGGRFILLPTKLPVLAEILFSFSSVENTFGPRGSPTRSSATQQYHMNANMTYYLGQTDVNWGLYLRTSTLESELGGFFQNVQSDREFITEGGAYLEPVFTVGTLRIQPGVLAQTFPSKSRSFFEPRLRLIWDLGIHRLSGAWGLYHQEIVGLSDRRDAGDVFTAWTSSPLGQVPEAMHVIAGYQVHPTPWLDFAVEGFYKRLSNLSVAEFTAFPRFTTRLQPADGRVFGVDVRLELSRGSFYGFINYGFSKVSYDARQEAIQFWFGRLAQRYAPPHDRQHQVNALGSLRFFGFVLNARWQFGSGLPFSQALGFDEFVLLAGPTDVLEQPGRTRVLYGQPYDGRLPTYHRLDLSLEREWAFSRYAAATFQAGVINTYDRTNLFYIDLFTLRRLNQLPLIPSFGLKLELK